MDLHDGQILRQEAGKPSAQFIAYDTYSFDMGDFSAKTGTREPRIGELPLSELLFMSRTGDYYMKNAPGITSEIHRRLSSPLYSLVYALLTVVYLGRPRTTREGRMSIMFTGFMIGARGLRAWDRRRHQRWKAGWGACSYLWRARRIGAHFHADASLRYSGPRHIAA